MSRRSQYAIGLILAAVFVWLFLRQADLQQVGAVLTSVNPWLVAATALVVIFTNVQRAWRWQLLLRPLAAVRTGPLLACTFMGWAVTILFAGRLGEVARPVLLSRRTNVGASAAIGSVVLERVFDALTVLVLLAIYLAFFPMPTAVDSEGLLVLDAMRTVGSAMLLGLLALGAVTVLGLRSAALRGKVEGAIMRWLPQRIGAVAKSFLTGMSGLRSPWLIARISLSSLGLWLTILATYVMMFHAFDLQLPWYAGIPVVALVVLGVMVPTPAAVGSFHKAAQVGLVSLWGVDNETAVAYAILTHAAAFLPIGFIGSVLLVREGLGFGTLSRMSIEDEPETTDSAI